MTAFIEDYRTSTVNWYNDDLGLYVPSWVGEQSRPASPPERDRGKASGVRTGAPADRTRVRTSRRPSSRRPGGVSGPSRRPNTRGMKLNSAPTHGVSNIAHVRDGRSIVRGPVQGVRRNAVSLAIVAGVGAVFGLMLHFSGLGAPTPDAPPAPTYVGVSSTGANGASDTADAALK
ncbi:hypothetical protein CHAN_06035 [Corynebacterium hansenii]|nr:hypothetical protein CHAN_06035 [Corynebacterium hansenii]